jgi:hypothetical protein
MTNRPQHRINEIASGLSLLCWMVLICGTLPAQTDRTITIRMLDSKTGKPITTSEIELHVGMSQTSAQTAGIPPSYVQTDKDGVGEVTFPIAASDIGVYARDGAWGYVNCDCVKDRPYHEHRYSISEILASGIVAPNRCNKRKFTAKPGEFIFFVRPMTFWEKFRN